MYAKSYFFHEEGLKPKVEYLKKLQYKQNLNCVFNFFKTLMHKSILEQILVQRFLRITTCRGNQSWFQRENTLLIMTEPAKKSLSEVMSLGSIERLFFLNFFQIFFV